MSYDCDRKRLNTTTAAEFGHREESDNRYVVWLICVLLMAAVGVVFGQTVRFDFTNFDDDLYVSANMHVIHGLSIREIGWALTHFHASHWLPLVWISYMVDSQCYGLWPGGYHLTNVLLHAGTVVLLFLMLRRLTYRLWPSAVVAALFAIHPLRVKSVAWVTERKDVLSGLLFVLTLAAYVGYARRPFSLLRYLAVVICYVLGLMAKPMLVTLPMVLLLLDYWPLDRLRPWTGIPPGNGRAARRQAILEKLPLLVLSAFSCGLTVLSAREDIFSLEKLPWGLRLGNAAISYTAYLGQMFWPKNLAVIYPLAEQGHPGWEVVGATSLLGVISLAVVALRKRHPHLLVGWLWYLGMLLPVIGLLQTGEQARADRFTYLPQLGVCMALVWGVAEMCRSWSIIRVPLSVITSVALVSLTVCAWCQTTSWRDSEALWMHALACTSGNATAENHMGLLLSAQGRVSEAIEHFQQALRMRPNHSVSHNNLGNVFFTSGRLAEAIEHYREAMRLNPNPTTANNLGAALVAQGKICEGIEQYQNALQLRPEFAAAHGNLGIALIKAGRVPEAMEHYEQALRIDPDYADAHYNLALQLTRANRISEAVEHFQQALRGRPDFLAAHIELGILFATTHRLSEAIQQFNEALQVQPDDVRLHVNLGIAYTKTGRFREAVAHFTRAVSLMPDNIEIRRVLAWLLATHEPAEGGDAARSVELAERICVLTDRRDASCLDALAAAYAAAGRFADAVDTAEAAHRLAAAANQQAMAQDIFMRLALYRQRRPYREPVVAASQPGL